MIYVHRDSSEYGNGEQDQIQLLATHRPQGTKKMNVKSKSLIQMLQNETRSTKQPRCTVQAANGNGSGAGGGIVHRAAP